MLERLRRRVPVRWGSLRRTRPISADYGYDRGTPVDRAYIERFLAGHAADIGGRVLEVRDTRYTEAYGAGKITSRDVLDIDESNADATIVADLADPSSLPADRFDCVIMTQTLQYVDPPATGLANLYRALVPNGVALVTVPCMARLDPDFAAVDRWRFTPAGLSRLFAGTGGWAEVEVSGFGNVLACAAFLYGIAAGELAEEELADHDDRFPLIACARARKAAQRPA
jgi:SAM-dependent methyltransferase